MSTEHPGTSVTEGESSRSYPFWIPVGHEAAACWLHLPTVEPRRSTGVLICPPWGFEHVHSHRTLRRLATDLASAGFVTIRLDYPGTGASTGDETTPGQPDLWLDAMSEVAGNLESMGLDVALIGLRLGATLAEQLAASRSVRHLVLWSPVVRGRRFIREQEAMRRMAGLPGRADDGMIEAGGFRLAPQTAGAVSAMELGDGLQTIEGEVLVVERDDLESNAQLDARLEGSGATCTRIRQSGYLDMVAEPQYTVVPDATITTIVHWLSERTEIGAVEGSQGLPDWAEVTTVSVGSHAVEEFVLMDREDGPPLFGVLTTPADREPSGPVAVLLNAGSVHHVGPNRFYLELARTLAEKGLPSLRFDIRNLGESARPRSAEENHPYPSTAVVDVHHALRWLEEEREAESFVLAGLCSGAYSAFRAALEIRDLDIQTIVPINPLTFEWRDGMSLDTPDSYETDRDARYYRRAVRSLDSWGRILKGQSEIGHIVKFVARHTGSLIARTARRALGWLGFFGPTRLARELGEVERSGRYIDFLFSEDDPGYAVLRGEAKGTVDRLMKNGSLRLEMIANADHTFSKKEARTEAVETVVRLLTGSAHA